MDGTVSLDDFAFGAGTLSRSIIFAGQSGRTESLDINARLVHFPSATCPNISPPLYLGFGV